MAKNRFFYNISTTNFEKYVLYVFKYTRMYFTMKYAIQCNTYYTVSSPFEWK